jgi:hypothetical protein
VYRLEKARRTPPANPDAARPALALGRP